MNHCVVFLVPPHNYFSVLRYSEMAARPKKLYILRRRIGSEFQQLFKTVRINRVCQKAPTCGGRIIGKAEFARKCNLRFSRPAIKGIQPLPVNNPRLFRNCGLQQLCAQRTHNVSCKVRLSVDPGECVPALAHGPLAEHLPGDNEISVAHGHKRPGLLQHQYPAIDAGIQVFSVAEPWFFYYIHKPVGKMRKLHLKAEFGGCCERVFGASKMTFEGNRSHLYPLLHDNQDCESAVETS